VGALAYFFEAGTSTPLTVYSSATLGEVNEHPHPVVADGNARWPQVFFDDVTDIDPVTPGVQVRQYYRVRVTDAGGALIYDDDSVPIIGQGTGEGGGPAPVPVDQNALFKTGDVKLWFAAAPPATVPAGWVRMNGGAIGAAGCPGAGERAHADTERLYVFLWNNHNDIICPVAGGRHGTALEDFNAPRALTLPDMRGRAPFGIDVMGNSSSGRIAPAYVDTAIASKENIVGAAGGDDAIALTTDQIPAHSHGATGVPAEVGPPAVAAKAALKAADHGHPARYVNQDSLGGTNTEGGLVANSAETQINKPAYLGKVAPPPASPLLDEVLGHQIGGSGELAITGNTSLAGGPVGALTGVSSGHENMPPFMLFTFLIKL